MRRLIYDALIEWKNSKSRKPLILEGARQVGKTYILSEFGHNEYDNLLYVNCHKNIFIETLFVQDFDIDRIIRGLSAYTGVKVVPEKTLIFIDEAQEAPHTIESLKYFCEDGPQYHIVVAGSLLGIIDHKGESYPVGKVNTLTLYPMTFEEFLWAKGENLLNSEINSLNWDIIKSLSQKIEDLLRQYYYVGGMPEVVKCYVETQDLIMVRHIQNEILSNYDHDFSKHAGKEAAKIRLIWKSLPSQLAKENKKFIYGLIKKGARAKEYENALQWLIDAGLVYSVYRSKKPSIPLAMYEDQSAFKLFVLDVGLLGALANMPAKYMLINNDVFKESKGAFTENYILQQMKLHYFDELTVSYYSKENSTLEIDFLIQTNSRIIPIEVKAEENVKSKSLSTFHNENPELKALRCSMKSYIDQEWMENIPLYSIGAYIKKEQLR